MKVPYIFVIIYWYGVLAQLVERYTGSVEVSGSNPLCSTKMRPRQTCSLPRTHFILAGHSGRLKRLVRARRLAAAALRRAPACGKPQNPRVVFIYGTASAVPFCIAENSGRLKRLVRARRLAAATLRRAPACGKPQNPRVVFYIRHRFGDAFLYSGA